MPRLVLKAAKDRDLYCEWSTIVDSVTFVGDRAEMLTYLQEDLGGRVLGDPPKVRLARTDETGTSALYGDPHDGAWEDDGFVYEQRGWLPRARLVTVLDRMVAAPLHVNINDVYVTDLLDPLDDD